MTDSSRVVIARGAWAGERRLLDEIDRFLPSGTIPPAPVVVVVSSHSLREHLLGRLAARRGAWLGLEVKTLAGVAGAILERSADPISSGAALLPLLVRRLAARESALSGPLAALADGYDAIAGAVNDLLDAGFVEDHLDAVEERLEDERAAAGASAVDRAQAIARVATGVRRELAARGLAAPADLLAAAAQRLAADPDRSLPCSALLVHGFADLTGVGSDLLEALVRHRPTLVVFDSPPELDGGATDWRFGRRLRERLSGLAAVETAEDGRRSSPPLAFRAPDPAREARAAVGWLATAPASERWEECALVARDIGSDLAAWARELGRQGVPHSADAAPGSARGRRAAGIVELLARGADTPLGVALAVAAEGLEETSGTLLADLRLALALSGARTLGAAAQLAAPERAIVLPVADRLEATAEGGRMRSREVAPAALSAACRRLASIVRGHAALSAPRPLSQRVAEFRRWLDLLLPDAEAAALAAPLDALGDGPCAAFEADAEEWRRLVDASWVETLAEPIGAGGGVALLSVTGARGRTFERLALVGMTRDRFPRPVRSDPLLPDALRLRLRELLPDLPVKAEGHDEERFLFAQLVAASRELALFRPLADGQGRALPPSPLLDELLRGCGCKESPAPAPPRRSAFDAAIAGALAGELAELAPALTAAIGEARGRFGDRSSVDPQALSATRLALLKRRSGDPAEPDAARLGPYLGAVGEIGTLDPRRRAPSVTALESLAGCGWRLFLERILRLAALPELVEALPSLPARLAGNVVHNVLEQMLPGKRGVPLAEALAGDSSDCPWPEPALFARRVRAAARRELADEGLDPALFETTLSRKAEALLEAARAHDWSTGRRELLAVEAKGEAAVEAAGGERRISFRVDRVERTDGELLLTDYKTGTPISSGVRPATRAKHLAAKIASGEALQLAVYLRGAAGAGDTAATAVTTARARYLYLKPDLDERARELALSPAELAALPLAGVLDALFAAWDSGAFAPRLLERDGSTIYSACSYCEVRAACVQGDSAARQRQARWATTPPHDMRWERAARAWWELRPAKGSAGGEEEAP